MQGTKRAREIDNSKKIRSRYFPPKPWGHRIIRSFVNGGREYQLHATKGWRVYRANTEAAE